MSSRTLNEKLEELKSFLREVGKGGSVIALSGGVDSSTLAFLCHEVLGDKAVAVTALSPIYPVDELEDARRVAEEIGIRHLIVKTEELKNENFVRNPVDRCYYCKKDLLEALQRVVDELGFQVIFEGTNSSDLQGHRPGYRAILEKSNTYSPWAEVGFTKEEIRKLAKNFGLSVHNKPSSPCLASRIPFGERITADRLERIWRAEKAIRKILGVRQVRVRDHGGLARIEIGEEEMELALDLEALRKVASELKGLGFKYVTLDLEGYRSGNLISVLDRK